TFFEINVALAFYMFAKEKLDYAVMETGLGGRLDATNTVTNKNKICIITKLGLDHTQILGKTISEIALEKAGIINSQNTTINTEQTPAAQTVIKNRCEEKNATLHIIDKKNYSIISSTANETIFDFSFSPVIPGLTRNPGFSTQNFLLQYKHKLKPQVLILDSCLRRNDKGRKLSLKNIRLGLIGIHQAENCSLALACLSILSARDKFDVNETSLRNALENINITGRLEIRKINSKTLIIDGAHNPQKMKALTSNLVSIYPQQKFTFVVAFKKGKDFKVMLKYIIPLADKILLTQFSTSGMDNHWSSIDNQEIATFLQSQNFKNFSVIKNKRSDILKNVRTSKEPVVITGSLYLISSIYPFLKI
ncbi:MAG: Mur ligase family protein, partial [Candidatus Moranbacteria bacterium]|nr:Mur ligase family protein [Candidatus Moranbacteria bacterium]